VGSTTSASRPSIAEATAARWCSLRNASKPKRCCSTSNTVLRCGCGGALAGGAPSPRAVVDADEVTSDNAPRRPSITYVSQHAPPAPPPAPSLPPPPHCAAPAVALVVAPHGSRVGFAVRGAWLCSARVGDHHTVSTTAVQGGPRGTSPPVQAHPTKPRHVRSPSRGSCSEGQSHGRTPVHGETAPRVHPLAPLTIRVRS
jgi:hypothetical protein